MSNSKKSEWSAKNKVSLLSAKDHTHSKWTLQILLTWTSVNPWIITKTVKNLWDKYLLKYPQNYLFKDLNSELLPFSSMHLLLLKPSILKAIKEISGLHLQSKMKLISKPDSLNQFCTPKIIRFSKRTSLNNLSEWMPTMSIKEKLPTLRLTSSWTDKLSSNYWISPTNIVQETLKKRIPTFLTEWLFSK